jgi:hypothetical protein
MLLITSREELHAAIGNQAKWRDFRDELSADDRFFDRELFQADLFDYSVVTRMILRAWGQRVVQARTEALHATEGFSGAAEIASVLCAMLIDFANWTREAGQHPIVILIEDGGYGEALSGVVAPTLRANKIDFVLTSSFQ